MAIRLAENIRAVRKARGLTQEQLSEVLGVTVGAGEAGTGGDPDLYAGKPDH